MHDSDRTEPILSRRLNDYPTVQAVDLMDADDTMDRGVIAQLVAIEAAIDHMRNALRMLAFADQAPAAALVGRALELVDWGTNSLPER